MTTLLRSLLHATNFASPLLRGIVPVTAAIFALQSIAAIPSILTQTERFYDISGALTNISCIVLSLYLPALRARLATSSASAPDLPSLISPFLGHGTAGFNWRQATLSAAVTLWALRLGTYLFHRILSEGKDSRFDNARAKPSRFAAIWLGQAVWCTCLLMPAVAVNAVPSAALANLPAVVASDVLGLGLFIGGLAVESVADAQKAQWQREKSAKLHDEQFMKRGLFSRSQFPHYFGEITLWTGIAVAAAGVLLRKPVQLALGLSGPAGIIAALGVVSVSPLFDWFVLLNLSGVPMSERKYNKLYGDRKDYQEWKQNTPKIIPRLW